MRRTQQRTGSVGAGPGAVHQVQDGGKEIIQGNQPRVHPWSGQVAGEAHNQGNPDKFIVKRQNVRVMPPLPEVFPVVAGDDE